VRKVLATSNDAEGHHLLGDLDERLGDALEAVREYERAARMYPSEQNYFDWGAELLLHKAAQPAVEVFSKGSALHPRSARMLAGLGAALYGVGSYEDAARRLCDASDLRPADPAPYLFLGQMEKTVSVPLPCTEEKLARFVQDQPASALANYYYAASLWKRRRGSESPTAARQVEALLEKAVKLDPSLGEAYVQLGVLYFAQNEFTKSIQAFQQAIRVSPQLTEAHYRLSLAYKRAGDEAKAHEEFEAYQQAEKTEAATVERQRGELKQFLIILKNQPAATPQ
jgi:tetratricopeptide (TPR) repeat protein